MLATHQTYHVCSRVLQLKRDVIRTKLRRFVLPWWQTSGMDMDSDYQLVCADAGEWLKGQVDGSVDLTVTSPPYNIGKIYERRRSISDYLEEQEAVIEQLVRACADTGSICWQVGNYVDKGEVYPLDIFYYDMFKSRGMKLRNRIVWHFGHGLHASKRFSGRYETVLWFTKTNNYVFNLNSVRVPSKYPSKRHFKGEKAGQLSGNPLGKNPSDYWDDLGAEWERGIWEIPNVKSNHPEKTSHPCQFPVELVERCVLALTDVGGLVLDPYSGVASTAIAALKNGRRAIGIDRDPEYTRIGNERVHDLFEGVLKFRPMMKPVHIPNAMDTAARVPVEWRNVEGSVYDAAS